MYCSTFAQNLRSRRHTGPVLDLANSWCRPADSSIKSSPLRYLFLIATALRKVPLYQKLYIICPWRALSLPAKNKEFRFHALRLKLPKLRKNSAEGLRDQAVGEGSQMLWHNGRCVSKLPTQNTNEDDVSRSCHNFIYQQNSLKGCISTIMLSPRARAPEESLLPGHVGGWTWPSTTKK